MASQVASGYDLDWVEDPPDDLKCLICLCVARDPQQHPGDITNQCGKIFCNDCITEYQKHKKNCPNCRQNLKIFLDSRSAQAIKALKVKCKNLKNGCEWTGELRSLETHLKSCDCALIPCTNKYETDSKQIKKLYLKDLPNHLANDCPRRQYKCPHCKQTGEYKERTTKHLDTCPKVKVKCPNSFCQYKIACCDIKTHRSTCPYEPMTCKYAAVGCEKKPLRKDIRAHEENDQVHLRVTTKKVLELTKRVKDLSDDVQTLTNLKADSHLLRSTSLTPCIRKLTNYRQWKRDENAYFSPPFYTSYLGYKMCLEVCVNGRNTNVSVYAHLMKGDHDDTLTWPFTGSVTFELLNQLEDKNHYKKIITFLARNAASKRVVDHKRGGKQGYLPFICCAALNYNATTNTQYLKDDTLVFRVSVKVPDHKPWLD